MDLIERQAALDALERLCDRECEFSKAQRNVMCNACHLGSAFEVIEEMQSVESEIVRCKECKYMIEHYDTDGNVPYWVCSEWDNGTDYDGFCHYAERRTDGIQNS